MNGQPCHDGGEIPLALLHGELARRGLKSELDTRAVVPRLRVFGHGEPRDAVAEFQNSVVVCCFGQDRWFAWPWAEPIARVNEVAKAAGDIVDVLGPGGR